MDYSKKDKLNLINIITQESEFLNTLSPQKEEFKTQMKQKITDKYIDIKSNYEIDFETEKSFYSSLDKQFNKNFSNEQENINTDPNDKIKDLLLENKTLLQGTIVLKEKLSSQEAKESKFFEKEQIYKKQLEINKKKAEQCDIYQNQLKERENYINELLNRYNALEKEYQQIILNKDNEIKDLNNKISLEVLNNEKLQNQINYMTESSNNIAKDLMKDINILEEKNRELEEKLAQAELFYNQEIKNLNKQLELTTNMPPLEHKTINLNIKQSDLDPKNNSNDRNNNLNLLRNSSETVVEMKNPLERQRTGEFAIDTTRGNDNFNLQIQNDELNRKIMNMKYENENLVAALTSEKELNQKLQQTCNEQKYFISKISGGQQNNANSHSQKSQSKEFSPQTYPKGEDIDLIKKKLGETEHYLLEINENNDILIEKLNKAEEKNNFLEKENKMLGEQVDILMKKLEKMSKFNGKFNKEFLLSISNMSSLNSTISILKLREKELLEKLEFYENSSSISQMTKRFSGNVSDFNSGNLEKNMNLPSTKNDNVYSKKQFRSFQKSTSPIRLETKEEKRCLTFRGNIQSNSFQNLLIITNEKLDFIETRKISEDNAFLKEQNFKYISELQKLNDDINSYKFKLNNLHNEREQFLKDKEEAELKYSNLQNDLNLKMVSINMIDDLKKKLNTFSEMNTILNDNFLKLQEKVDMQNQKIIEKNTIIKEKEKLIETLQNEKQSILTERINYSDTLRKYERELETLRKPIKPELSNEIHFEEKIKSMKSDNRKLLLKIKQNKKTIEELYDEIKKKDDRLRSFLQDKNEKNQVALEDNERFKSEFNKMKQEIELLIKENGRIKAQLREKSDLSFSSNSKARNKKKKMKNNLRLSTSFDNTLIKQPSFNNENSLIKKRKNIHYNKNDTSDLDNESDNREDLLEFQNDLLVKKQREKTNKIYKELEQIKKKLSEEINEKEILSKKVNEEKIEKDKLIDLNKKLEETLNRQTGEITVLRSQNSNFESIQKQINEMNSNQYKISQLFNELEKIKQENKKKVDNLENANSDINKKLKKTQNEYENLKKETAISIQNFKNENSNLLSLIKNKEIQIETINNEKNNIINTNNMSKNDHKGEICKIREEFQSEIIILTENYEKIIEKTNRNRNRLEKLTKIHENHLNFLIDRFKQHITDLIHALNSLKLGYKYQVDNPILNERLLKNVETFTSLLNDISQVSF